MGDGNTSKGLLRERDKAILRKHDEELRGYKISLEKQCVANTDLRNSLFDIRNRANRLVESLGFTDITEAQVIINAQNAENSQLSYKACLERAGKLEIGLKEAKALVEKMQAREIELEEENTALRQAKAKSASDHRQLLKEYENVQNRHRESIKANEDAQLRRQKDHEKWENFKRWILCSAEIAQYQQYSKEFGFDKRDISGELFRIVKKKKYKLAQLASLDDQSLFNLAEQRLDDTSFFATPAPTKLAGEATASPLASSSKANQLQVPPPFLDPNTVVPPARLIRRAAMVQVATYPSADTEDIHSTPRATAAAAEGGSSTEGTPQNPIMILTSPTVLAPDSETEDDSQSFHRSQFPPPATRSRPATVPYPRTRTQHDSQTPAGPPNNHYINVLSFDSSPTSTPTKPATVTAVKPPSKADMSPNFDQGYRLSSPPVRRAASQLVEDDERPKKYRRVTESDKPSNRHAVTAKTRSAPPATRPRTPPREIPGTPTRRPKEREKEKNKENAALLKDKRNPDKRINDVDSVRSNKGKGKEKDKTNVKDPLAEYSKYKGRGRYAQNKEAGDNTINEMYEIDRSANGGLDFQYAEVVRGKEKRKRLLGGDCDECREYYEAVGPMPPRLQPPLWKSPVKGSSNTPSSPVPCPHHKKHNRAAVQRTNRDDDDLFNSHPRTASSSRSRDRAIESHKQNISRHRAAWERGNTPPAYWDIGFPNTQMAEDINARAKEMQREKKERIEREAAREGGRYRRR